jgi:hypothetical protein
VGVVPRGMTPEEEVAQQNAPLLLQNYYKAMALVTSFRTETKRLGEELKRVEKERDDALISLDKAEEKITSLKEERGRIHGAMIGTAIAVIVVIGVVVFAAVFIVLYTTGF